MFPTESVEKNLQKKINHLSTTLIKFNVYKLETGSKVNRGNLSLEVIITQSIYKHNRKSTSKNRFHCTTGRCEVVATSGILIDDAYCTDVDVVTAKGVVRMRMVTAA